jgi:hypothetical protein
MAKRRVGRSDRKKAVTKADQYFSKYIRARDGACVVCGSIKNLQCGHYLSRYRYATRWDEKNAFAQCAGCNINHENNPEPLRKAVVMRIGEEGIEELNRKWNTVVKLKNHDLEEIAQKYKKLLQKIESK